MDKNLFNCLNKISKRLENYHYEINHGGCCFFAAMISKELNALNFSHKVCTINDNNVSYYYLNKSKRFSCIHVFLKIEGMFYDCKGFNNLDNFDAFEYRNEFRLKDNTLLNIYYKTEDNWNTTFLDCEENLIKKIKTIIKDEFKKYRQIKNSSRH